MGRLLTVLMIIMVVTAMLLTLGLGVLSMIGGAESVNELHSDGTPDLPHHKAD